MKISTQIAVGTCLAFFTVVYSGTQNFNPKDHNPDIKLFSSTSVFSIPEYNGNKLYMDGDTLQNDLKESYKRIDEIGKLEDNWNENGAHRFSKQIISEVKGLVKLFKIQPHIFPTACDSIQFEFENMAGDYLEFEIFEGNRIKEFFLTHDGKNLTQYISKQEMVKAVDMFYER